jgi:hypothetical protein
MTDDARALLDAASGALRDVGIIVEGGLLRQPGVVFHEGNAALDPSALADPMIALYASLNPCQLQSAALICLAPLNAQNWVSAFSRAALRALRPRRGPHARPHLTASTKQ